MKKIYYWQYVVNTQEGYRHEYSCEQYESGNYDVIFDEETDRHTFLFEDELEKPDVHYDSEFGSNIICFYTFEKDMNHFIEIIAKVYETSIQSLESQLKRMKSDYKKFQKKASKRQNE